MRARHLLCLLLPIAFACGGESPAVDDTISAAPPEGQAVQPSEPVGDSATMPTDTGDTLSSGAANDMPSQPTTVASAPIEGADTAVGPVRIIGTALDNRVVVQTSAGPIGVAGDLAETIRSLQGMEVWIQGPLSIALGRVIPPRQITVERFEVRKVAGMPVVDGTLRQADGEWTVTSASGRRTRLASAPEDLRRLAGRRVWVAIGEAGAVQSFGVVD